MLVFCFGFGFLVLLNPPVLTTVVLWFSPLSLSVLRFSVYSSRKSQLLTAVKARRRRQKWPAAGENFDVLLRRRIEIVM